MTTDNTRLKQIDEQIKQLEKEKVRINKKFEGLTEEQYFATVLHDAHCTHNHTDGCSWDYEKWDNVEKTYAKKRYLEKARNLIIMGYTADEILKIMNIVRGF